MSMSVSGAGLGVVAATLLVLCGLEAAAQTAPAAGKAPILAIRDLSGIRTRDRANTPVYGGSMAGSSAVPREWGVIRVEYDSYPEWIDALTIEYHVLSLKTEKGQRLYSYYKRTVRYRDIARGRKHSAVVYLMPPALLRYGDPVAVTVEFTYGGELVATQGEMEASMKKTLPEDWHKKKEVLNSAAVTARHDYLINREDSPFAFVNMDDYEFIER